MIDAIKKVDGDLNAVVSYLEPTEPKEGKLSGWATVIKDNANIKGTLTTASCKYLENHVSIYTASFVEHLVDAGALLLAKTSMDELAMGGTNRSALTGIVHNPLDLSRISGGSSGGSAALVGAGVARLGIGSDTGDSVRKPASYCGVVGVKPTYGRISRYGVIPYAASLDHVSYFTQNVADAALALEVLAGYDALDMTSLNEVVPAYSELLELDLTGKRIGIFKNVVDAIGAGTLSDQFSALVAKLEAKGAVVVEKEMDQTLIQAVLPTYTVIANSEASTLHANLDGVRYGNAVQGDNLEELMIRTRSAGFSTFIKERFVYGAYALDWENIESVYNQACKVRRLIVDEYNRLFEDVDVLITPATAMPAPKIDVKAEIVVSDDVMVAENFMALNNFNGSPSMTIPFAKLEGMPVGLNISAKVKEEAVMFAYAKAMEDMIGWEREAA